MMNISNGFDNFSIIIIIIYLSIITGRIVAITSSNRFDNNKSVTSYPTNLPEKWPHWKFGTVLDHFCYHKDRKDEKPKEQITEITAISDLLFVRIEISSSRRGNEDENKEEENEFPDCIMHVYDLEMRRFLRHWIPCVDTFKYVIGSSRITSAAKNSNSDSDSDIRLYGYVREDAESRRSLYYGDYTIDYHRSADEDSESPKLEYSSKTGTDGPRIIAIPEMDQTREKLIGAFRVADFEIPDDLAAAAKFRNKNSKRKFLILLIALMRSDDDEVEKGKIVGKSVKMTKNEEEEEKEEERDEEEDEIVRIVLKFPGKWGSWNRISSSSASYWTEIPAEIVFTYEAAEPSIRFDVTKLLNQISMPKKNGSLVSRIANFSDNISTDNSSAAKMATQKMWHLIDRNDQVTTIPYRMIERELAQSCGNRNRKSKSCDKITIDMDEAHANGKLRPPVSIRRHFNCDSKRSLLFGQPNPSGNPNRKPRFELIERRFWWDTFINVFCILMIGSVLIVIIAWICWSLRDRRYRSMENGYSGDSGGRGGDEVSAHTRAKLVVLENENRAHN